MVRSVHAPDSRHARSFSHPSSHAQPHSLTQPPAFWLTRSTYYEQPSVHFQHRVYVELDVTNSSGASTQLVYSTLKHANTLLTGNYRAGIVQVSSTC